MYPRSFLCEEAKIKQHTPLKKELCKIGEEAIRESRFTSFFYKYIYNSEMRLKTEPFPYPVYTCKYLCAIGITGDGWRFRALKTRNRSPWSIIYCNGNRCWFSPTRTRPGARVLCSSLHSRSWRSISRVLVLGYRRHFHRKIISSFMWLQIDVEEKKATEAGA